MVENSKGDLRLAAERTANDLHALLIQHAEIVSTPGVNYSMVAAADDSVLDALNSYRESVERITGLSALLRLSAAGEAVDEDANIQEAAKRGLGSEIGKTVLEARWYFDVANPGLVVQSVKERGLVAGSAAMDEISPEREDLNFQMALATLFEHDVPWPPPECSEIGLNVTGMDVAVYAQEG